MSETSIDQDERIRQAADKLFTEAKYVGELTRKNVLALAGVPFNRTTFLEYFRVTRSLSSYKHGYSSELRMQWQRYLPQRKSGATSHFKR